MWSSETVLSRGDNFPASDMVSGVAVGNLELGTNVPTSTDLSTGSHSRPSTGSTESILLHIPGMHRPYRPPYGSPNVSLSQLGFGVQINHGAGDHYAINN